jgi:predicted DsbA family dithiol-disulfide isomerase
MTRVEVFAEVTCPFTYVGLRRFVEVRRGHPGSMPMRVRAWALEWVNGRPLEAGVVEREVAALRANVAPDLFAGFDRSTFPHTSIPAFGLAAAAYGLDDATGEAVSLAIREALFEHGADVSDASVLREIGAGFGVEPFDARTAAAAACADYERGRARGVQGSPHFFVGGRSWFCPMLDIRHNGDDFEIARGAARLREFYDAALT